MEMEMNQTRLRLTTRKDLLTSLRRRRRLAKDEKGEKLILQFDGMIFEFRPGVTVLVGKTVADALVRESYVINGTEDLVDPYEPTLERLGTNRLDEPQEEKITSTTCPICRVEKDSVSRLVAHIQSAHADRMGGQESEAEPTTEQS